MDDDQPSRAYPDPPAAQGGGFKGLGSRLALIPPLSFVLIVSLLPAAPSAWPGDSVAWLVVLNTLFLVVAPLIASYFAARAYAASGSIIILAIGSGLLLSGLSSHIAGHVMRGHGGTNSAVTIHNTGFLLCSLLNLAASWMSFSGGKKRKMLRGGRTLHVPVFYGASFLMVGLITLLALQDLLPAFFIPGQGPTPFRQAVLSLAVTFFLIASAAFMFIYFRIRVSFLCWYALSLLLIGQGLGIILFVDQLGSLMNWAGRAYQYLGGAYFL
ncbi:MAG: hypothetical protein K9M82_10165, partial [Deltaproteobacteria bacterium]|nr:hypothetical protein [Deltaproteobacteria bacterium]